MRFILTMFAVVLLSVVTAAAQSNRIQGVWQVTEAGIAGTNGFLAKATQPSLYIFTKKHYSIMGVLGDTPRPEINERSPAPPEQVKEVFVDRFTANGGTYEVKDGKLTTWPSIAKSPSYMKAGNFTISTIEIKGNTMTLTTVANQSGPVAVAIVAKLVRVE